MQSSDVISFNIWQIIISLLNLLILFLILKKFLFKPVKNVLAQRQQILDEHFANAENAEKAANTAKQSYETSGSWSWYGEPKYSKAMAYKAVEREIRQLPQTARADLSDVLEGATNGKICCGFGHGKKYWSDRTHDGVPDGLATEAFAEMWVDGCVKFDATTALRYGFVVGNPHDPKHPERTII